MRFVGPFVLALLATSVTAPSAQATHSPLSCSGSPVQPGYPFSAVSGVPPSLVHAFVTTEDAAEYAVAQTAADYWCVFAWQEETLLPLAGWVGQTIANSPVGPPLREVFAKVHAVECQVYDTTTGPLLGIRC